MVVKRLVWDEWNIEHIARHGVNPREAEDVCRGNPVVQKGHSGRLAVFGPTPEGKIITVVIDPEGETGVYYPVTARPSSRKERAIYAGEKGVSKQ